MAAEIANAYVALTVKMPGVESDIASALGSASSSVEKSGSGLGSSLMKGLKGTAIVGAAAVAGGVVGTLGTALVKGFSRLQGIDNATAKMEGLGFSAQATQGLMDNALESVKGTAFGLDEAAGVAAQLAATGIGPGEEMASILDTIANSAAAAGGGMGEMGSIFAKAATQANGVQNDILQQLADRGIPIYQALADQLGVTAGEVFDLASAGEIGFDQFATAAQNAAGGVAEAMGGTVSGSFDNLIASLGRIGAGLLGGVFEGVAPALQGVTAALGPVEVIAGKVGQSIGEFLAPGLEMLANLGSSGIDFSMFGQLLTFMSPLSLAFQAIQPVLPLIVESLNTLVSTIVPVLVSLFQAVLPILTAVVQVFAEFAATILPVLLPVIESLVQLVANLLTAVMPLLEPLLQLVQAIFPLLAQVIAFLMPIIEGVVNMIGSILVPVINMLVDVLSGVITFLVGVFTGDWEKAWDGIVQIFEGLFTGIEDNAKGIINGLIDLINGFLGGLNVAGDFISDMTGGVIDFTIPQIPHLAEGGVVSRSSGGTLAVIGEGRYDEAVVPLSPQVLSQLGGAGSGGGVTQNIYPSAGMDEAVIGQVAANHLNHALRGV